MTSQIKKFMVWRSISGASANIFKMTAIFLMPVSLAIVLYFSMPIWTSIFAYFYLGESLNRLKICSICFGLIGVILVSKPPFIEKMFSLHADAQVQKDKHLYPYFGWGAFFALMGAMSTSNAYIAMRRMGKEVHSS